MLTANKCKHCGEFLDGTVRQSPVVVHEPPMCSASIWSLVLGILSLTIYCSLLSIPAVITGHTARRRIRKSGGQLRGEGMAVAGLITGYIGTIIFAALLVSITVPTFSAVNERVNMTRSADNLRQLAAASLKYAEAHNGQLPATLEEVVKDQKLTASVLTSPLAKNNDSPGYELLVHGNIADHKNPAQVPFIRDVNVGVRGVRVVAYLDGTAKVVNARQ